MLLIKYDLFSLELKIEDKKIDDGYKLTEEGRFTVDCYYKGNKLTGFNKKSFHPVKLRISGVLTVYPITSRFVTMINRT